MDGSTFDGQTHQSKITNPTFFYASIAWRIYMSIKKRVYRALPFEKIDIPRLHQDIQGLHLVVGIDVAKTVPFVCFMDQEASIRLIFKFKHPDQTLEFVLLLKQLPVSSLVCVLEPTGTYGDVLRYQLAQAEIPVVQVSPIKTERMAEVVDGVPSAHDAKSAAILAGLHLQGISVQWTLQNNQVRHLKALYAQLQWQDKHMGQAINRLEAFLARHWPELPSFLKLKSPTLLQLLSKLPSPSHVLSQTNVAKNLMKKTGGNFLAEEKILHILESAQNTIGIPVIEQEALLCQSLAQEALSIHKQILATKSQIKVAAEPISEIQQMASVVGVVTASILYMKLGPASQYPSPQSYVKAAGLNLTTLQSGKSKPGHLHLSKRGDSSVRKFLYFAAMRWIQTDAIPKAWYLKKVKRDGGKVKIKALVAIMRKLLLGLWHTGQQKSFDSQKLFDLSKLNIRPVSFNKLEVEFPELESELQTQQ